MIELFKNKYKIKSIRLPHWDYSSCGGYFVTICTKNRECFFGNVSNKKMKLSQIGEIANKYWNEIPKHYKNVSLDEYILMPNHIHGIVIIEQLIPTVETPHCGVSTNTKNPHHKPQWKPNSLGSIICQFKSITTKHVRSIGSPNFSWQSRFHEHIIRNDNDLNRIRKYIKNNPLKWKI